MVVRKMYWGVAKQQGHFIKEAPVRTVREELTVKQVRYALIKGWVERKYPEKRPDYCQPDPSLILLADEIYRTNKKLND